MSRGQDKKGYKIILLIISLILAGLCVPISLFIPRIIGNIINILADKNNSSYNIMIRYILEIIYLIVAYFILRYIMGIIGAKLLTDEVGDYRKKAFFNLQYVKQAFLHKNNSGTITSIIATDGDILADGLLLAFNQFFTGIFTLVWVIAFMFNLSWHLSIIILVTSPISFIVTLAIAKLTYKMFRAQAMARSDLGEISESLIDNQKLIRLYSDEAESEEAMEGVNSTLRVAQRKSVFVSSITNPLIRLINAIIYALVAGYGGILIIRGHMNIGVLTSFLIYVNQFTRPLNEVTTVITELQNALVSKKRIVGFIKDSIKNLVNDNSNNNKPDIKGNVTFRNVDFQYESNKPIIKEFNLDVKAKEIIAIVGPTGAGKSTLINLLMRFYDVTGGEILIDGVNIKDIDIHYLRDNIGMVLQETFVKSESLFENIVYGNKEARLEDVKRVATLIGANSFIERLPQGYMTVIGDGQMLSEGERQLICICRLLLRNPKIVILDEATSNLDLYSERIVQRAFLEIMKGRTAIVVAHRLETIEMADKIVKIDRIDN